MRGPGFAAGAVAATWMPDQVRHFGNGLPATLRKCWQMSSFVIIRAQWRLPHFDETKPISASAGKKQKENIRRRRGWFKGTAPLKSEFALDWMGADNQMRKAKPHVPL
jgi:hypothetical protein